MRISSFFTSKRKHVILKEKERRVVFSTCICHSTHFIFIKIGTVKERECGMGHDAMGFVWKIIWMYSWEPAGYLGLVLVLSLTFLHSLSFWVCLIRYFQFIHVCV